MLVYSLCGANNTAWSHAIQAVSMAQHLKLFDSPSNSHRGRNRDARDYTAWAVFTFQRHVALNHHLQDYLLAYSHNCWYFLDRPLLDDPPKVPLPDPSRNPHWYGEFWLRYPTHQGVFPSNLGHLIYWRSKCNVILNSISLKAFSHGNPGFNLSASELLEAYKCLTLWFNNLPRPLSPRYIVLPSHLKLQ
jgi:hypothetical protein